MLTQTQIYRVELALEAQKIEYLPLKDELLDHICCQIETHIEKGNSFESGLAEALETFGPAEIAWVQSETLNQITHKSNLMKRVTVLISTMVAGFLLMTLISFAQNIPSLRPIDNGEVTSGFGMRHLKINNEKVKKMHNGIDIKSKTGTPIKATAAGTVKKAETLAENDRYGNNITLNHDDGFSTRYAHLDRLAVATGETVKKGQVIGYVGNTGVSTAPHLHYEVHKDGKAVDPEKYIKK